MVNVPDFAEASNHSAGDGESRYSDIFGIFKGISGLAGDVGRTVNSVRNRSDEPNASTNPPPFGTFTKNPALLYGGIAVVVGLVLLFLFKRGK